MVQHNIQAKGNPKISSTILNLIEGRPTSLREVFEVLYMESRQTL